MSDDVTKKNFEALRQGMNKLYEDMQGMNTRMGTMERNHVQLQADLANQKQLVAHLLGRGMGSTVHKE